MEAAKGKLKMEFGENLSEVVQIAMLTEMLPSDLQDKVSEMGNGGDARYHRDRGHHEKPRESAGTDTDGRWQTIGAGKRSSLSTMFLQLERVCRTCLVRTIRGRVVVRGTKGKVVRGSWSQGGGVWWKRASEWWLAPER